MSALEAKMILHSAHIYHTLSKWTQSVWLKSIVDSETVTSVLNKLVIGEVSDNTADMRWVGLLYSD